MDKTSQFQLEEALDEDDDFSFLDGIEEGDVDASVSREFLRDQFSGLDAFCHRPWRTLKITPTSQTRVCCDFFTQLPVFDFPTAKDFHRPTGMWNHPFMQHMRRTMGTEEEVPFCTLCLTKDKRSPAYAEERAKASDESFAIYHRLSELSHNLSYKGSLGAYTMPLDQFKLHIGKQWPALQPFKRDRSFYRRIVTKNGFQQRGRVLMYGCKPPTLAPFLAEACDHLTVVDRATALAKRAVKLCAAFDLDVALAECSDSRGIALEDGTFDAIWFNPQNSPPAYGADRIGDLTRLLSDGGVMHIYMAPGPGKLLEDLVSPGNSNARQLLGALETGPQNDGALFFTSANLRAWLRRFNLRLDVLMPIAKHYSTFDPNSQAAEGSPYAAPIRDLFARYTTDRSEGSEHATGGSVPLERALCFSCSKR